MGFGNSEQNFGMIGSKFTVAVWYTHHLGPKFSWVNFGLRGHELIFSMPMRCYF